MRWHQWGTMTWNIVTQADHVIKVFGGSGTTYAVAEAYNRKWLGTELELEYCNIIQSRLSDEDHISRIANAKDELDSNKRRKKLRG